MLNLSADVHRSKGAIETICVHFSDIITIRVGLLESLQEKFDKAKASLEAQVCFESIDLIIVNYLQNNSL